MSIRPRLRLAVCLFLWVAAVIIAAPGDGVRVQLLLPPGARRDQVRELTSAVERQIRRCLQETRLPPRLTVSHDRHTAADLLLVLPAAADWATDEIILARWLLARRTAGAAKVDDVRERVPAWLVAAICHQVEDRRRSTGPWHGVRYPWTHRRFAAGKPPELQALLDQPVDDQAGVSFLAYGEPCALLLKLLGERLPTLVDQLLAQPLAPRTLASDQLLSVLGDFTTVADLQRWFNAAAPAALFSPLTPAPASYLLPALRQLEQGSRELLVTELPPPVPINQLLALQRAHAEAATAARQDLQARLLQLSRMAPSAVAAALVGYAQALAELGAPGGDGFEAAVTAAAGNCRRQLARAAEIEVYLDQVEGDRRLLREFGEYRAKTGSPVHDARERAIHEYLRRFEP